jgi:hypothetical protein
VLSGLLDFGSYRSDMFQRNTILLQSSVKRATWDAEAKRSFIDRAALVAQNPDNVLSLDLLDSEV